MHFMLFWGVSIQVVGTLINLLNMALFQPWVIEFPRLGWYLGYELVMDIAGVMILIGVGMAAFRRYILRPKSLESNWDDGFALIMLTLIVLVGYTNEATRLLATSPAWANWSPIGNWYAGVLGAAGVSPQQAQAWHDASVYIHATLAMALVAAIPFTKMRHLIYTPLNILNRTFRKSGVLDKIEDIETTELLGVGKDQRVHLAATAFVRCLPALRTLRRGLPVELQRHGLFAQDAHSVPAHGHAGQPGFGQR